MKTTRVIMFGYKALSGKDTAYNFIKEIDPTCIRLAFADKLKSVVEDLYGFSCRQMHGDLKNHEDERYPNLIDNNDLLPFLTPRRILQIFGQDQRKIYPNIWAEYIFRQIEQNCSEKIKNRTYIITDFRFKNEYDVAMKWSQKTNFDYNKKLIIVKIERPILRNDTDISEVQLDTFNDWDHIINNDKSLIEYEKNVKEWYKNITHG